MRLALFSIGLGLLGLLGGCAGPAAAAPWALPLAQEVTRKPVDLVVPNEDGSQYVMVEARPFSPKGEAKRKFVRSARKACKGDYMVMSENSATRRVGVVMNGVTGRMGANQHLERSIMAIRGDGGVVLGDGTRVVPEPILVTPLNEVSPALSPDGRWMAYVSDETGRAEVYVRAFPEGGARWQVSTEGGTEPVWSRDGRELFYVNPVGEMVSVAVSPGNPPTFGQETKLFQARLEEGVDRHYDVSADGQRFILNRPSPIGAAPIVVTTDWQRLLQD